MTDRRLVIEAGELRIFRVLETVCYNEMLRAMGYPPERQSPLTFWQRRNAVLSNQGVGEVVWVSVAAPPRL